MAAPSDFPVLRTVRSRRGSSRGYHVCGVCGLTVEPRNSRAHHAKCLRLKRADYALWLLWKLDMNDLPAGRMRNALGPALCRQLVERGYLEQGPLRRDGSL